MPWDRTFNNLPRNFAHNQNGDAMTDSPTIEYVNCIAPYIALPNLHRLIDGLCSTIQT